jgi:hypothetical protein
MEQIPSSGLEYGVNVRIASGSARRGAQDADQPAARLILVAG